MNNNLDTEFVSNKSKIDLMNEVKNKDIEIEALKLHCETIKKSLCEEIDEREREVNLEWSKVNMLKKSYFISVIVFLLMLILVITLHFISIK